MRWRLARREVYDSLSALTQAAQRTLAEPRQVRPPLQPLEALQARSYQLLAQLTAIKSMLLLRRAQLDLDVALPALQQASRDISAALADTTDAPSTAGTPSTAGQPFQPRPDPLLAHDLTPWLLRRLSLATAMARELRLAELQALRGGGATASQHGLQRLNSVLYGPHASPLLGNKLHFQ